MVNALDLKMKFTSSIFVFAGWRGIIEPSRAIWKARRAREGSGSNNLHRLLALPVIVLTSNITQSSKLESKEKVNILEARQAARVLAILMKPWHARACDNLLTVENTTSFEWQSEAIFSKTLSESKSLEFVECWGDLLWLMLVLLSFGEIGELQWKGDISQLRQYVYVYRITSNLVWLLM